jgi:hypothetical protein
MVTIHLFSACQTGARSAAIRKLPKGEQHKGQTHPLYMDSTTSKCRFCITLLLVLITGANQWAAPGAKIYCRSPSVAVQFKMTLMECLSLRFDARPMRNLPSRATVHPNTG